MFDLSGCATIQRPPIAQQSRSDSLNLSAETLEVSPVTTNQPELPESKLDQSVDPGYVEPLFSTEYGKLLLEDTAHVLTAPFHWDRKEWLWVGASGAGLVALSFFDKSVSQFVERNHNSGTDTVARNIDPFGQEYSAGVLAAFYLGGAIFDNPKAKAVAQDGLAASLIASGLITTSLKFAFGRSRHEQGQGAYEFDPFNGNNTSFPSGHTTQAFAVASVIAAHYDSVWVKAASFGTASLVGYARVQRNKHWATDVGAGALIGTLVGRSVVHFNQNKRAGHLTSRISLTPLLDDKTAGLSLSYKF